VFAASICYNVIGDKMKNQKTKAVSIYLFTIILSVLISFLASSFFTSQVRLDDSEGLDNNAFHNAKITAIISDVESRELFEYGIIREVSFRATISRGIYQYREIVINQEFNEQLMNEMYPLKTGDSVLLYRNQQGEFIEWMLVGYQRVNHLWTLIGIFILLIILFGRFKGFNAIVSLGFTIFAVFFILIPAILINANIYAITLLVSLYITLMSFVLIGGLNRKTIAATIGCIGGIAVATLVALLWMGILKMSGVLSDEFVYLIYLQDTMPIDLRGILFVSIVIGALGAVMDVAMSIASSLDELTRSVVNIKRSDVIRSGLNIGKDIMGTMSNTLILAYIGGSLPTILLLIAYAKPINLLANSEYIASEILQAIAGSLGILFTIPITAIISALLIKKKLT